MTDIVNKPDNWEKAVLAALVRIKGGSQRAAADAAGCGERTVRRWEKQEWWGDAKAEAADRWLVEARQETRGAFMDVLKDRNPKTRDPATIRFAAERLIEGLEPPKVRQELSGPEGGPIEVSDARAMLAERLRSIRENTNPEGKDDNSNG